MLPSVELLCTRPAGNSILRCPWFRPGFRGPWLPFRLPVEKSAEMAMGTVGLGLVDCHCHLSAPDFNSDLDAVLERAKKANVMALVAVAEHAGEFERIMQLSERYTGFILPCLGVHPVQELSPEKPRSVTLKDLDVALPIIENYKDRLLAIGEVGLDFSPRVAGTDEEKEEQRQVLIRNVHSRSAGRPTINLLREQGAEQVLLHAFDGRPSVAMEGVRAGYYFSIPPSIVRSGQTRNEPCNISISAEFIAQVKGISVEEVQEVTTQNALKLFPRLRYLLQK